MEWLRRLPQKGPWVTSSLKLMCSLPGVPAKAHDMILRRQLPEGSPRTARAARKLAEKSALASSNMLPSSLKF